MTQERYEEMQASVSKQVNAGFSMSEIKENLIADGYSKEEIDRLKFLLPETVPAQRNKGREYLSLVVSLFLIVRGCMLLSNGKPVWGAILFVIGVGGLIAKIAFMARNQ